MICLIQNSFNFRLIENNENYFGVRSFNHNECVLFIKNDKFL